MITVAYLVDRYQITCSACGRTLAVAVDERGLARLLDEMERWHRCSPLPLDLPPVDIAGEYPLARIARLVGELQRMPATWAGLERLRVQLRDIDDAIGQAFAVVPRAA